MKRILFILAVLIALGAAFFRDGPLGPPLFSSEKHGEVHITGAVWFSADNIALEHAATACERRNMGVVSKQVSHSFGLRWIEIVCSP